MRPIQYSTTWPVTTNCRMFAEVMVRADVSKIDDAWRTWGWSYVEPGTVSRSWAAQALDAIASGQIEAPIFLVDQCGRVRIIDGKRRFSILRDSGVTELDMTTSFHSIPHALKQKLFTHYTMDVL